MRILITRPAEDAETIAERLAALGHTAIVAPLLTIRYLDRPLVLDHVQAILATSANGVRAVARNTRRRDWPVFAVGPQTAEEARRSGFASVRDAAGDVTALAEAVSLWASAARGALLHATGSETAGQLAAILTAKGFHIETAQLYEAVAAPQLPPPAAEALAADSLDAAMFFSPRSARIFRDRVTEADLAGRCAKVIAISISEAASDALAPLAFAQMRTAAAPNQDAMLARLTS